MSFKVVGIGEVLWDLLPGGPQLGGAPVNFACHARQLGADVQVITRLGNDAYGREILERFRSMRIDGNLVQIDNRLPTGTATVLLNAHGVPQFAINNDVAWDALCCTDKVLAAMQDAHAVYFGTLAQRSQPAAAVIQQMIVASPPSSLRVLDLNLRQEFYSRKIIEQSLEIANVLKLNESELTVLSSIFELKGGENQKIEQLVRQFDLETIALTRGENGSLLYQAGQWSTLPGVTMDIVDTVGAGDGFTAALVMGLLNQLNLENVHNLAADVAGYVCSQPGATPVLPRHLRVAFESDCENV